MLDRTGFPNFYRQLAPLLEKIAWTLLAFAGTSVAMGLVTELTIALGILFFQGVLLDSFKQEVILVNGTTTIAGTVAILLALAFAQIYESIKEGLSISKARALEWSSAIIVAAIWAIPFAIIWWILPPWETLLFEASLVLKRLSIPGLAIYIFLLELFQGAVFLKLWVYSPTIEKNHFFS